MNMSVDNGNGNGSYCYISSYTESVSNNQNSIDYTKKSDKISKKRYLMENIGLLDSEGIDYMLPKDALKIYVNTEYNNEHHNLQINIHISQWKNSSVSALTSPSPK